MDVVVNIHVTKNQIFFDQSEGTTEWNCGHFLDLIKSL